MRRPWRENEVALLPAVGAGTWSWGPGVVGQCGCFWSSPAALSAAQVPRAAAAKGRVPRVYVQKGGVSPGRGPLFC